MIDNAKFGLAGTSFKKRHESGRCSWVRTVLASSVAALWLSACGGSEENNGAQVQDENVAQAQNAVKAALKATGLAQENEKGELAVGYDKDGESVRMGQNLPAPEWLPKGFPLPSDLSIQMVTVNLIGEKELQGRSTGVTQSELAKQVTDWSAANGWELITANDMRITTVSQGGEVIDLQAEDGVGMQLTMSTRSVTSDRQAAAVEIVSTGTATVTLGDETHSLKGECKIKGSSYGFEYYAPDGSAAGTVDIQAADSQPQGSAMLQTRTDSSFNQYTISFPMYSGEEPEVKASGKEFSVSGKFGSMGSAGMQAVPGTYKVRCE